MSYFLFSKKGGQPKTPSRLGGLLLTLCFVIVLLAPFRPAQAQLGGVVTDIGNTIVNTASYIWDKASDVASYLWQKGGSIAFQRTLASALNKIAYDAANYIGSGGKGQNPLFVTQNLGDYLAQIGDEAAGQYIETFVNNLNTDTNEGCSARLQSCREDCLKTQSGGVEDDATRLTLCNTDCDKGATACVAQNPGNGAVTPSFNVCSPSSLEAKVKIGLGLVDQNRPQAPNCTASKMIKDWGDDIQKKIDSFKDPEYLTTFANIFDPRSNDLGIYFMAQSDMSSQANIKKEITGSDFVRTGGWLDVRNIAGELEGVPGEAQRAANTASQARQEALGKTTGDILVDAANVFLNQLYISAFDNLLRSLAKKSGGANNSSNSAAGNREGDPKVLYGESALREVTNALLQPKFAVRADYDILSELSMCQNPKSPGPNDCVIDDKFRQAISEKKTVAEAIKDGYLHGDWQLTTDNNQSNYSLRNISVLRKYRILPVGWEQAVSKSQAQGRRVTLKDLVSCFDYNDDYSDFSSGFDQTDQGWCQGLVDPNWVLKAPLNYCKKEGISSQIISSNIIPGIKGQNGVADVLSSLNVIRAENYCADNQTCIKEKDDGSCEAYGYCNEEKRTWDFGSDSCAPINNTCQSFTSSTGQSVSYLENTLDYAQCNADNSGCRRYSLSGAYATSTGVTTWDGVRSLYLNKNLSDCDNKEEGCTGLLRVKPAWGANLIMNANFNNDLVGDVNQGNTLNDWPLVNSQASIVDGQDPIVRMDKAMKLVFSNGGGLYSSNTQSLLPANFQVITGQAYTLSADVYLVAGDSVTIAMGPEADGFKKVMTDKNGWQTLSVTRQASSSYNEPRFSIIGSIASGTGTFYVKNIKFEMGDWGTGYTPYGSFRFYEKLLPSYLEKTCYVDSSSASKNYSLKADAPAVCSNYARRCNKDEVDCESYQSTKDNFVVPAKVISSDYCPGECLGYDVYISKANHFNSAAAENIIPSKATVCSAVAAGCNEFTNLDSLAAGGERKEYYTSLKHCIKPDAASCASFYAWEGTANGYQLKSYNLKKASDGTPEVTSNDSLLCNAAIYNLPLSDPAYNADCREFYNAAGKVSYHLAARTITCSDNCHAYRMTEKNIDKSLSQIQCLGSDKYWDISSNSCNVCLNGGVWDGVHKACVYQAIPGEGQTCQASANGCREYNGNSGSNVRLVSSYDFESGLGNWYSNCQGAIVPSSVANSNNGHSLQYKNNISCSNPIGFKANAAVTRRPLIERVLAGDQTAAQLDATRLVRQGSAYSLKFLARSESNVDLNIYFINDGTTKEKAQFSAVTIKGGNDWNLYQANLDNLDHSIGQLETLAISGNGDFFLDDIVISEITDRYYLIKGSSLIPDVCYYDTFDRYQGADYNLGCSQYSDRSGNKHNLHKFTKLCSESAVGCEQMIDTKNFGPYGPGFWENGIATSTCNINDANCTSVAGDSAIYAVYDQGKQCTVSSQGCSRLGQGQGGANLTGWSDVFKNNNPDQYDNILCSKDNIGCEEWKNNDDGSLNYFKNPGIAVCSYRAGRDAGSSGKSWYRAPVKRCDLNGDGDIKNKDIYIEQTGPVCLNDKDCGTGKKCLVDNNDYPCSFSYYKTIGLGGAGNQVQTPDKEVGLCEASASGCTEYIDPVSRFASNLVSNPDFRVINNKVESWSGSSTDWGVLSPTQQVINIKPNKLYSLMTKKSTKTPVSLGGVVLDFKNFVKPLLSDNTLATSTRRLNLVASTTPDQPVIFNSLHNDTILLTGGSDLKTIEIKELVIGYKLQPNIDKKSCNGVTKFDNGCILFNERSVSGASGLASLKKGGYDAFASVDGNSPTPCSPDVNGSCTANALIKVRPDRICSQWLDCVTYTQDKDTKQRICYALGQCDRLDDAGDCANFVGRSATSTTQFSLESNKNSSGYSLLNKYDLSQMKEVGLNSEAHFDFEDSVPALSCERSIDYTNPASLECTFDKDITKDSLVRGPEKAPTDYPAHGRTYLKVPATYQMSPQGKGNYITLELPRTGATTAAYYINYLINTRTSGLQSKVVIWDVNGNRVLNSFLHTGNNGWTRVVDKFYINSNNNRIKIYLTSDASAANPKEAGFVYFDDINIEPVLETGPMQYSARECRLYPTTDALTCLNNSSNTITDGLEGYCLEHDPFNANICQLWYPVDKISSSKGFDTALGYKSKFPLNYCTEASGNFDFVEKRMAFKWADNKSEPLSLSGGIQVDKLPIKTWTEDVASSTSQNQPTRYELVDYQWVACNATTPAYAVPHPGGHTTEVASSTHLTVPIGTDEWSYTATSDTHCWVSGYRQQVILGVTHYYQDWTCETREYKQDWACVANTHQGCFKYVNSSICENSANNASLGGVMVGGNNNGNYDLYVSHKHGDGPVYTKYMCVPNADKLTVITATKIMDAEEMERCDSQSYSEGWGRYDAFLRRDHANCDHPGCINYDEKDNVQFGSAIRVQDYNELATSEDNLKLVSDRMSDDVFRLTCNKFVETVEASGENKAWAWRTGKSASSTLETPVFFQYNPPAPLSNPFLQKYGRNRDAAPFGAATWSEDYDLLSSNRINFRDRYSKAERQEVFAGRPYGCAGGVDDNGNPVNSCSSLGYCSNDPNIYCLYSPIQEAQLAVNNTRDTNVLDISRSTCEGLNSKCMPLWTTPPDYKNILKNVFLKSYNAYSFGGTGQGYLPINDSLNSSGINAIGSCGGSRPNDSTSASFCAVFPTVSNPKLCRGESTKPEDCPADFRYKKGIYRLQFNSSVDPEQQPLRRIYIDWGDGTNQVVTDQDQHPSTSNPHVFYHYYNQDSTTQKPSIRIFDNWERYGTWEP